MKKYTVLRDTREKVDFWDFPMTSYCNGTILRGLKTADYTLEGFEEILSIERKRNVAEFATNVTEKRFERELERLDVFPHPYLILDFDFDDLLSFPANSGIPKKLWGKIRIRPDFLLKRYTEIDLNHKVKIIFAGHGNGANRSELIFKYINQKYGSN